MRKTEAAASKRLPSPGEYRFFPGNPADDFHSAHKALVFERRASGWTDLMIIGGLGSVLVAPFVPVVAVPALAAFGFASIIAGGVNSIINTHKSRKAYPSSRRAAAMV